MKPRALDLFCGGGGISCGLAQAGFDVTGVDLDPKAEKHWRRGMEPYGGTFICADALEVPLDGYDLICASPPCQAYSSLRHLVKGRAYPDLVSAVRARLVLGIYGDRPQLAQHVTRERKRAALSITGHSYHTVESHPDSRPERKKVISVVGPKGMPGLSHERRAKTISVTGATPQRQEIHNATRETFSINDARAAMGIGWLPMKWLSQAIPPVYGRWIAEQALAVLKGATP